MKLYKISLYIILIIFTSCEISNAKIKQTKNDTTKVLELALLTAFYHENLPGITALKYPYRFKDSILFTSDSLSLITLPLNIDTLKFKILTKTEILSMLYADSNMDKLPNYLSVERFERSDTGYYVNILSLSSIHFGGGGSIGLYIAKVKDSFIVKSKMSSSIN